MDGDVENAVDSFEEEGSLASVNCACYDKCHKPAEAKVEDDHCKKKKKGGGGCPPKLKLGFALLSTLFSLPLAAVVYSFQAK